MNIKSRPLLIATGTGLVVQIILTVISTIASVLATPAALINPTDPNAMPNFNMMGGIMALSFALCCVALLIDAGVGAFYAYLHNKEEIIVLQDGLVGGATAGALARIISSVISVILSLLMTPFIMNRMADQMGSAGMPNGAFGSMVGASMVGGLVGGVFGICIALISGSVLGAAGGGIMAALSERNRGA